MYSFGDNFSGQLGLGDVVDRYMPTKLIFFENLIPNEVSVFGIYCGGFHTIFNTTDGLYGCGNNRYNELGLKNLKFVNTLTKFDLTMFDISVKIDSTNYNLGTTDLTVHDVYCGYNYTILVLPDRLVKFGSFMVDRLARLASLRKNNKVKLPEVIEFDNELTNYSLFKQKRSKCARFIVKTD